MRMCCSLGRRAAARPTLPVRWESRPAACPGSLLPSDTTAGRPEHRSCRRKLPETTLQLSKKELLILDDWGLEKLNARQSSDLLEVMEDRYQRGSTIIISQLPVSEWYKLVGNPTVADALMDRLLHNGYRVELKGESMRKLAQTDQTS
jgi:DNA replication protein DnaC